MESDSKIFVAGHNGVVGSAIVRNLKEKGFTNIITQTRDQLDLTDFNAVKSYFIVDEAQNLTPHEVKTIITRAGEGTKIVFTGDINQIDHPYLDKKSNGVSYLINRMEKQKIFSHINLKKGERSELAELASNLL